MKKLLVVLLTISLLAFGANAMAWGTPKIATATDTINPTAGGASDDSAVAVSPKLPFNWLNLNKGGDDGAYASGWSEGTAENKGTAAAGTIIPFKNTTAFAIGTADAEGHTKAGAFALDLGLSLFGFPIGPQVSVAGSAVGTTVSVEAEGTSGFAGKGILGGGIACNESTGMVQGEVGRGSYVNEINSGATWAQGSEQSAANFYGTTKDKDVAVDGTLFGSYGDSASSSINMTGGAFSAGGSIAYIEPNGNTQSAFAAVGNMAVTGIQGADYQDNHVNGSGNATIQSYASNNSGYAIAGATGSFSYSGTQAGAGATIMHSTSTVGNNSFSSHASGASFATSK